MTDTNAGLIGEALRTTADGLRPWIKQRVGSWPTDFKGRIQPQDPSYLIWVALNYKPVRLYKELGDAGNLLLQDLRHTRNRWAHHVPFDDLDVVRSLDTCRRILLAVGADGDARTIEGQIREVIAGDPRTAVAAPELIATPPVTQAPKPASGSHRRMRSIEFRQAQWDRRFDPHVEPINRLVDDLIEEAGRWMPYVPPYHGGVDARILLVFQDPGKKTSVEHDGSGFLGSENDDPSAERLARCYDAAGIDVRDVISWNAYPWFRPDQEKAVTAAMLEQGVDPLRRLLELLPKLHTVVSCGSKAHESWQRFAGRYPETAQRYRHFDTRHTSGRGITKGGQHSEAVGMAHVTETLRAAADTTTVDPGR